MAPLEPVIVANILLSIPDTDNIAVHDGFAKCVIALPLDRIESKTASDLEIKLARCLDLEHSEDLLGVSLFSEHLASIIKKLSAAGFDDDARALARSLFRFESRTQTSATGEFEGTRQASWSEVEPLISDWDFDRLLGQIVPVLRDNAGIETLDLLCDLLADAATKALPDGDASSDDLLWIARPAIEEHEQNSPTFEKATNSLISAIRDTALWLLHSGGLEVQKITDVLLTRPLPVFQRFAMHLLSLPEGEAPSLVRKFLLNHSLFDNVAVHHEHFALMKEKFGHLDPLDQDEILSWIEVGPDVKRFEKRHFEREGRAASEEEIAEHQDRWRRRRLTPIQNRLSSRWTERLGHLIRDVSKIGNPEFLVYQGPIMIGAQGIPSSEELGNLSDDKLIEFLEDWKPSANAFDGDPQDLAQHLQRAVLFTPERFAALVPRLNGLNPEYLGGVFSGLRDAIGAEITFQWDSVLEAAKNFSDSVDSGLSVDLVS